MFKENVVCWPSKLGIRFCRTSCGPLVLIKCNKNMGDFSDSMEEVLLSKKKCLLSVTPTFYPSRFLFFKHILRDLVLQWNMIELLVYVIVELWLLLIQKAALNGPLAVVILSFSKIYPLNCGNMATSSSNIEQRCKSEGLKTLTKVIFIEKILLWKFVDFLKNYSCFLPPSPIKTGPNILHNHQSPW